MLHTQAGTHARPQRNPPVSFQCKDTKGSGKNGEEQWSWPKSQHKTVMSQEQDSWYPMTISWLFPWDCSAFMPAFIFTRVRRQTVSTGMLFFNIFSVTISLHRKYTLALGGLTEGITIPRLYNLFPSAKATKRNYSAAKGRGLPGTTRSYFCSSSIPNLTEVAVNSKRFQHGQKIPITSQAA